MSWVRNKAFCMGQLTAREAGPMVKVGDDRDDGAGGGREIRPDGPCTRGAGVCLFAPGERSRQSGFRAESHGDGLGPPPKPADKVTRAPDCGNRASLCVVAGASNGGGFARSAGRTQYRARVGTLFGAVCIWASR